MYICIYYLCTYVLEIYIHVRNNCKCLIFFFFLQMGIFCSGTGPSKPDSVDDNMGTSVSF